MHNLEEYSHYIVLGDSFLKINKKSSLFDIKKRNDATDETTEKLSKYLLMKILNLQKEQ